MKKLFLALGAVAMMGLAACDPDNENNLSNNGQYAPEMKISEIRRDGDTRQAWTWNENKLERVDYRSNGQTISSATFTYDGDRLVQVTGPYDALTRLIYSGNQISQIEFQQDGIAGTFNLEYNNGKVNKMTLPFSREILQELAGDDFPEFITRGTGEMVVDLTWTGNNVSRQVLAANFSASISASEMMEMAEMMGMSDMLEPIAPFVGMLAAFQFPITLSMTTTTTVSHDDKHNPFQGYMGRFSIQEEIHTIFSANNPTTVSSTTEMNYSLTLPDGLPAMLAAMGVNLADYGITFPITGTVPMDEDVDNYSYQYNDRGFPTHITDDYDTEEIIYAE